MLKSVLLKRSFLFYVLTLCWSIGPAQALDETELGKLLLPGEITVTNPYLDSCDSKVECGQAFKRYHAGIDYRARVPTEVTTPVSGTVVASRYRGKDYQPQQDPWGTIIIEIEGDKPGYFLFLHMSKSFVRAGDRIQAGCVVGLTGKKGTIFPHLHVEYKENRSNLNRNGTPSLKHKTDVEKRGNMSPTKAVSPTTPQPTKSPVSRRKCTSGG